MNDYIIIGGGITGLYALDVLNQKNNYNILLCDERNYLGGRVVTHKQPHYEKDYSPNANYFVFMFKR